MADDPTLNDQLRSCARAALHLELRDGYAREDPMFHAWQAGHRDDPADRASWWRPWLDLIAETSARGIEIRRARIISEPISDYVRFEHDLTFTNIAAGEEVRWLPRRQASDISLPGNDFWLFDGEIALINHFSGDGDWTGTEQTRDPSVVKLCAAAFETVWNRAIPHGDYHPV